MQKCIWSESTQTMKNNHDKEWGIPVYEDRLLFEKLTYESAQAGLN